MVQRVNVYLKSIHVIENGHYSGSVAGTNLLLATWKQPNFRDTELNGGGAMRLKDFKKSDTSTVFSPPKSSKWRLFKCEVDGDSEIEFILTNKIEVPKAATWLLGKLADNLKAVAAVPLIGSDIVSLLKDIGDATYNVAVGSLKVPKSGLTSDDYSIPLIAGQDLYVLPNKSKTRPVGQKTTMERVRPNQLALKAGGSNGEIVVSVDVVSGNQ